MLEKLPVKCKNNTLGRQQRAIQPRVVNLVERMEVIGQIYV
jgi:hypothetical protein